MLFDLFRGIRKAVRPPDFIVLATDFLFWVICAAAVSFTIWRINSGILRIYEFIGLISGAVIYFLTLSRFIVRGSAIVSEYIFKIIKIILKFLLTPFVFLYKISSSIHFKKFNAKNKEQKS